jgi:REP element-mobilizing transposase RayT
MTDKFQNKYRIPSARWAAWDYSSNGAYFVTICVADRAHAFGRVVDGKMVFSPLGQSAEDCWNEIPAHFPFVELGAHQIMPNHVHGVVVIAKTADADVETQNIASLPPEPRNRFGPQSQNLASIIRGYKIGVTKFARANNILFAWQARYHDHVIRNDGEWERITKYIIANPMNWKNDEFNEK